MALVNRDNAKDNARMTTPFWTVGLDREPDGVYKFGSEERALAFAEGEDCTAIVLRIDPGGHATLIQEFVRA